jgi:hypothetical protein
MTEGLLMDGTRNGKADGAPPFSATNPISLYTERLYGCRRSRLSLLIQWSQR